LSSKDLSALAGVDFDGFIGVDSLRNADVLIDPDKMEVTLEPDIPDLPLKISNGMTVYGMPLLDCMVQWTQDSHVLRFWRSDQLPSHLQQEL